MSYNEKLAHRIREALAEIPGLEEKNMFRGIAFMVNGKMCVNVSGDKMMCRFDPALQETVEKNGFQNNDNERQRAQRIWLHQRRRNEK